jgi:hypothetical protein
MVFLEHAFCLGCGILYYIKFFPVWGAPNLDGFCPILFAVNSLMI